LYLSNNVLQVLEQATHPHSSSIVFIQPPEEKGKKKRHYGQTYVTFLGPMWNASASPSSDLDFQDVEKQREQLQENAHQSAIFIQRYLSTDKPALFK